MRVRGAGSSLVVVALAAASAAGTGGCQGHAGPPPGARPPTAVAARPPAPVLPRCASAADVDRLHGRRVLVVGRYEVEPVPGGKRLQAALIVLPDGTRLLRSYRPVLDELGLVNKRVVAVGTVYRDSGQGPNVQAVQAPHLRPERITLAPGETPYPTKPTELPPPPIVSSAKELDALPDRWVQAWGTLVRVTPHQEDGMWANAVLRLVDGTELHVRAVARSRWQRHVGTAVTVIGRAEAVAPGAVDRRLVGRATVCAGHVRRCDLEIVAR